MYVYELDMSKLLGELYSHVCILITPYNFYNFENFFDKLWYRSI